MKIGGVFFCVFRTAFGCGLRQGFRGQEGCNHKGREDREGNVFSASANSFLLATYFPVLDDNGAGAFSEACFVVQQFLPAHSHWRGWFAGLALGDLVGGFRVDPAEAVEGDGRVRRGVAPEGDDHAVAVVRPVVLGDHPVFRTGRHVRQRMQVA